MHEANLVPVTVLTGFLGAGKTTLLNRILSEQHGHRIAVIENEFGPAGVDNELLVTETNEQIVEMNNGCICCTVRGDLVRILADLRRKREAKQLDFERVIIETTGMANPGPVTQTFFIEDEISSYFLLDSVITVVDAKHGHDTLDQQVEAQNQVGFADRILMSKTDLVDADEVASLRERLVRMNPRAPIKPVNFGQVPLKEVLDLRGFNLNAILEIDPAFLAAEHPDAAKSRGGNGHAHEHEHDHVHDEHCGHDHDHDHHGHHHHHDDAIKAFVFQSGKPFDSAKLEEYMGALTQVYGPDMLRYKGVLFMNGTNRRMIFQGVHMLMGADVGRPWGKDEKPASKIVFIGRNLPKDTILKGLEACLAR
ncbi:MAG TPA: GTP-binding protein [Burkholderiaceae bacterium]|nr:GTP-binding protein [Burkholderiaceae bacterium]HQR70172.1 GTP-binding protein [Burkholderiaceae bacterium]